jgi:L-fucose isomerase-like protein
MNVTAKLSQQIVNSSIIVATSEQISSELSDEAVILNLKTGVYHGLNEVGARIWSLIQEPKTVADVKDTILSEYQVEPEVCATDLMNLLQNLLAAGLINVKNQAST